MQRRLAAILATDVVGFSRMVRASEETTLAAVKALHDDIIIPTVASHNGRVVKLMGDGMLAEFASVVDAVRAGIAIQRATTARDWDIRLRAGINLGDIIVDGDDIQGDGVVMASRLESIADPGSVFVTAAVYDQVRDRLDDSFDDAGAREVKNIDRPVHVWRWTGKAAPSPAPDLRSAAAEAATQPSIIVLPFANLSNDPEQEYFSDGVTEDVITDLSKISELAVIARATAFTYKTTAQTVPDICGQLGVGFALTGSIRKAGNRVRVSAELVDGARGTSVWTDRYDRDLTDIFEVQDDVTRQIVGALKLTLTETEEALIAHDATQSVTAHDYYIKGREMLFAPDKSLAMFNAATDLFQKSIEADPAFGGPHAGMGMAHVLNHQNLWTKDADLSLERAGEFAAAAVEKDPKDAYAHYVAALVALFKKDYAEWSARVDQALAISPNYAPAMNLRGLLCIYQGAPDQAIPIIERAMRLDPAFQQQAVHFLGTAHFVAGNYAKAASVFKDRIVVNPNTDLSRGFLASALGHMGRVAEAKAVWRKLKEINPAYIPEEHIGRLPFQDATGPNRFMDGLRKAGLIDETATENPRGP
ncbi:MAG: adenylate/guanylate cyclase domain-containing protein [Pseudomonadota bacterium]